METLVYLFLKYITVIILAIVLYLCLLYLKNETLKKNDDRNNDKDETNDANDLHNNTEKLNNSIKILRDINAFDNKEKINVENLESKLLIENLMSIKNIEPNLEEIIEKEVIKNKVNEENSAIEIDSINNSVEENNNDLLKERFLLEEEVKDLGKYIISVKEFRDLTKCKDKLKKLKKSKRCTKKMIDYLDKEMRIKCEEMNVYFDNYYNRIETIKQAPTIVNDNQYAFVSNVAGIAVKENVIEPKIIVKENFTESKIMTSENVLKKENTVVTTNPAISLNFDMNNDNSTISKSTDVKKKSEPELRTIMKSSDVEVMQSNGKLRIYTLPKRKGILKRISNYFTQKVTLPLKLIYLERVLKREKEEKRRIKREKDIEKIRLLKIKLEKTKKEEHNAKVKTKREKAKQKTLLENEKKKREENLNRSMW